MIRRIGQIHAKWWIVAWSAIVLLTTVALWVVFPAWLTRSESGSTTLRNMGLLVGAAIGLPLAIWRSTITERQADAAHYQSEIAARILLNERFQRGAEMLGSETLSVRLGGLYALARLSEKHPEHYHVEVMRLFCAFARYPVGKPVENISLTNGGHLAGDAQYTVGYEKAGTELAEERREKDDRPPRVREDVQAVMDLLRRRSEKHIELEQKANFRLDLRGVKLRFGSLAKMNLDGAFLMKADLSNTILSPETSFVDANLSGADLENANLVGANLSGTQFTGSEDADPRSEPPATGLIQEQLDRSKADPSHPPVLNGVLDSNTNKPLVWNGRCVC